MRSTVRINVFLASKLGTSRRNADRIIDDNRVRINGIIGVLGQIIDPVRDQVDVDGFVVKNGQVTATRILLYKPTGYITARSDRWGRRTVVDLLPSSFKHLNPAGRLDYLSEGLLLLSDDGGFNYEFTHPKFQKEKEYILTFGEPITSQLVQGFESGIELSEGFAKADRVYQISDTSLQVTIHQGWNRQLRRMAAHHRYKVIRLIRTRIGQFTIDGLRPGEWKEITPW